MGETEPIEQITETSEAKERIAAWIAEAPEPGIYPGVSFDEYRGWKAANCGLLKKLGNTASKAKLMLDGGEEVDKPAYLLGRLFHTAATEPKKVHREFILQPPTYDADVGTKKNPKVVKKKWHNGAEACKEWKATQAEHGISVVTKGDMETAKGMAGAVRKHPKLGRVVDGGQVEVSVVWIDPASGLPCKGRWDILAGDILIDLKSCKSARDRAWMYQSYQYGYHIQAAMYLDAQIALAPPKEVPWFVFAACENYAPYDISVWDVRDDMDSQSWITLQLGRAIYKSLLGRLRHCIGVDEWPGYGTDHRDLILPPSATDELQLYGLA